MMSNIDRVLQLIALATDPAASEEETRTAALLACRMIRKHSLLLSPSSAPPPSPPPPPPPKPAQNNGPFGPSDRWRRPTGRFFVSKYNGTCVSCGEPFFEGDRIYWKGAGKGSEHPECHDEGR